MIRYHHPPFPRTSRLIQLGLLVLGMFLLLGLLSTGGALAQDDLPTVDTSRITADQVNEVAEQIWCPLCSGVRLDSCELKACEQMKEVIAIKLAQGEDAAAIKAYFLEQYGPQILGAPPAEGFNWLAWILPPLALVVGGIFVWRRSRQMVRPDLAGHGAAESTPAHDEYHQRLEEELERYG